MTKTTPKWEAHLQKHRQLKKQGAESLHQRVSLLVQCYDDVTFKRHCDKEDGAEKFLDQELDDTGVDFLTWRAVLELYPELTKWQENGVRVLLAYVIELNRKRKPPGDNPEPVKWKARAIEAERQVELLLAKITNLEDAIALMNGHRKAA